MHDLAFLRPKAVPSRSINPIKVAPQDNIEVGADVHAIGHPTGGLGHTQLASSARFDRIMNGEVVRRMFNIGQRSSRRRRRSIPAIQEDLFFRMMGNSWG
jgi:hypothetical protein